MVGEGRQLVIMFSNGGLNKANNKWPCVCVWGGRYRGRITILKLLNEAAL